MTEVAMCMLMNDAAQKQHKQQSFSNQRAL